MLGKVIPEAPLHAGGALIGGVQLDIGRSDADDFVVGDMQVHLTAHPAVWTDQAHDFVRVSDLLGREPLPRHDLEDRAGGTDANALAAPRASRAVGVAVRADDDFGVLAAVSDVERSEEHTSELQSLAYLVCRLLLE